MAPLSFSATSLSTDSSSPKVGSAFASGLATASLSDVARAELGSVPKASV